MEFDLMSIATEIPDEATAYKVVEDIRWPNGPECPHCGNTERCYFREPKGGARKTRTGSVTQRRLWKCGACRKQFSVLVGTVFHGTKVPLRKWLFAIYMMSSNKNGVAANELRRTLNVSAKSAWFMLHRIREAMTRDPLAGMLSGTIVADETWIGGKPKNKHRQGREPRLEGAGKSRAGQPKHMTPVFTLVNKETGEARSRGVANVTGATLNKVMAEHVDKPAATLHTDGHLAYRAIGAEFKAHEYMDHSSFEYVRGEVSTNQAENFFSQLKRSIDGTHHSVSPEHLDRTSLSSTSDSPPGTSATRPGPSG